MRLFKVGPDGHSPRHSHVWEHEIYIIKGTAGIFDGEKEVAALRELCFCAGGVEHQIKISEPEKCTFFVLFKHS